MFDKLLRFAGAAALTALAAVVLFNLITGFPREPAVQQTLAFSDLLREVDQEHVADILMSGHNVSGHFANGLAFNSYAPELPDLVGRLIAKGARVSATPTDETPSFVSVLISWVPLIIWVWALWYFVARPLRRTHDVLADIGRTLQQLSTVIGSPAAPHAGAADH